jgi:hypothetical protein
MVGSAIKYFSPYAPGGNANLLHVAALKRIIPRNRQEFQILNKYHIISVG